MKVVQLIPGSGNTFYCQNCLRDMALIHALRKKGHDIVAAPMYLPLFSDYEEADKQPVFFGAVSLYLRQKLSFLRHAPGWVDRMLNAPAMLRLAARQAGATQARDLEDLTVSMLRGEEGNQASSLEPLIAWLDKDGWPDVIHISNALLLGLARPLRQHGKSAIVCGMQDEDGWVDSMEPGAARRVWSLMADRGQYVDLFIASSDYYAERMKDRLGLESRRVRVVRTGVDVEGHGTAGLGFDPPVIGFLARMCPDTGLDILADAFVLLKKNPRWKTLQLRIAGGKTSADDAFLADLHVTFRKAGVKNDVEFIPEFDRPARLAFLSSLTVLSVPVRGGDASGLYMLEAMASGVPVVQPAEGAFPEILRLTGGGVEYTPNDASHLAEALDRLLQDPARVHELGQKGRGAVRNQYSLERMAGEMIQTYEEATQIRNS